MLKILGRVRLLTRPSLPLDIGRSNGVLVTTGNVDREAMTSCRQRAECDVTVDVTVQPVTYFRIIQVLLTVIDENDNAPQFSQSAAILPISESASIGSSFLLPSAMDVDSPEYGVSRYQLLTAHKQFTLRVTSKLDGFLDVRLVLRRRLDRESADVFHVKLAAFDGGQPALHDVVNITVQVLDSNDNEPVFERARYQLRLPEDLPLNTRILTLSATDADLAANQRLIYALSTQTRQQLGHVFINSVTCSRWTTRPATCTWCRRWTVKRRPSTS